MIPRPEGPLITFDPLRNPLPPIFPIPTWLNPYAHRGDVDILAAALFTGYMPNVKAMIALHMMEVARKAGALDGVHTLVEASSGNTGLSLANLAPYYGLKLVTVTERDLAPGKVEQLRLVGVEKNQNPEEEFDTIEAAAKLGEQPGWFNFNQYGNQWNVEAHKRYTGPHLWEGTDKKISVFSNGMGTAGTALGVKAFFESIDANVYVLGVACAEGNPVPGLRSYKKLEHVTLPWQSLHHLEATRFEAYSLSLKLFRSGMMVGPSSGMALAGLLRFLKEHEANDFEGLRNEDGRVVAVFGCGDTIIPYMEKYSFVLNNSDLVPLKIEEP
jgi:cysteine synthase A